MTDPDETGPQKTYCGYCLVKNHLRCRWLTHRVDCGCSCPWLQADLLAHFPSLRRQMLKENSMTQPVNDDDYTEDAEATPAEDLPEPTDPSHVPPDEGDAGTIR